MDRTNNTRLFKTWEIVGLGVLIFAACVCLGAVAVWMDLGSAEREFRQRSDSIQRDIARRFGSTEAVLTSLVGLQHASDDVRYYEFAALARELLAAYPYIRTIARIQVVPAEERAAMVGELRSSGFPQFEITELGDGNDLVRARDRPVTMPIRVIEPFEPELVPLIGFDVLSEPTLAIAVNHAIESGEVIAADPIELPNTGKSVLVFKAAYLGHGSPATAASRRRQVSNLFALYLDPAQFFLNSTEPYEDVGLRLYAPLGDESEEEPVLVFEHAPGQLDARARMLPPFTARIPLAKQGQSFVLEVTQHADLRGIRIYLVAFMVLLGAVACGLLIVALRNQRLRVQQARLGERILRDNEQRFRDYAEVASDWFWSTDDLLRFEYISEQLTSATGLNPDALLGREDLTRFSPDDELGRRHLADLRARRPFRDFRYEFIDPNGGAQWWSVSGKPIFNEGGDFLGYRGTGRNVTLEVQAQKSLQRSKEDAELANRAKSEFLANVSHELRTPLNAIIGFSEIICNEMIGPMGNTRYVQYASDIHDSGQHLLSLINDILDLSKIESGVEELYEEEVDISKLVRSLMTLMKPHAEKGKIDLTFELADTLPSVIADQRKLKQILVNLIGNAIKFTRPGGKVALIARGEPDGELLFEIRDTGIGMTAESLPKALSKFHQIDSDLDRKYEGTGLGLPLAKSLVELHGGAVEIESVIGQGTTVIIRLPAHRVVSLRDRPVGNMKSSAGT